MNFANVYIPLVIHWLGGFQGSYSTVIGEDLRFISAVDVAWRSKFALPKKPENATEPSKASESTLDKAA